MPPEPPADRPRFVYALTSVTARLAIGAAGVAVIIRDAQKNTLKQHTARVACTSQEGAVYEAIKMALTEARALGARQVAVYSDDATVVGHLGRGVEVPEPLMLAYMQVRALMNQFREARVCFIDEMSNAKARRLSELAIESDEEDSRAYQSPGLPLSFQ
jgi:ribonuclease HI